MSYLTSCSPALQMYKELGHVGTARTASTSCSSVAEAFTPRKEYNSQISGVATPFTGFLDLVSLPKLSPFGTLDRVSYLALSYLLVHCCVLPA